PEERRIERRPDEIDGSILEPEERAVEVTRFVPREEIAVLPHAPHDSELEEHQREVGNPGAAPGAVEGVECAIHARAGEKDTVGRRGSPIPPLTSGSSERAQGRIDLLPHEGWGGRPSSRSVILPRPNERVNDRSPRRPTAPTFVLGFVSGSGRRPFR